MRSRYEGNVQIDRPDNEWTPAAVERLFLFCQLDRAMPYDKVVWIYEEFVRRDFDSFARLRELPLDDMVDIMWTVGVRFPKETAKFLYDNVRKFDGVTLMKMSRDEIADQCYGFGMKLASMFHNRIHGTQYAIIDVHIDRYLREHGCKSSNYKEKEKYFIELAKQQGKTPEELDWEIWDSRRIGRR